jgi:hypothetical protein
MGSADFQGLTALHIASVVGKTDFVKVGCVGRGVGALHVLACQAVLLRVECVPWGLEVGQYMPLQCGRRNGSWSGAVV